jgi:hypothetical protein
VPNATMWVQPVSFFFVFVIVTTTIRGFLINLVKVGAAMARSPCCVESSVLYRSPSCPHLAPPALTCPSVTRRRVMSCRGQLFSAWSSSVTSNSVLLFLAQVMGAYFMSVVLLIRMAMPAQYRSVTLGRAARCSCVGHHPFCPSWRASASPCACRCVV